MGSGLFFYYCTLQSVLHLLYNSILPILTIVCLWGNISSLGCRSIHPRLPLAWYLRNEWLKGCTINRELSLYQQVYWFDFGIDPNKIKVTGKSDAWNSFSSITAFFVCHVQEIPVHFGSLGFCHGLVYVFAHLCVYLKNKWLNICRISMQLLF